MKRLGIALLSILVLLASAGPMAPNVNITITQTEANALVDEQMPQTITRMGATVTLQDADVIFLETGEIEVAVSAQAEGWGLNADVFINGRSSLRYDNGRFFLNSLTFDQARIVPDETSVTRLQHARAIRDGAVRLLRERLATDENPHEDTVDTIMGRLIVETEALATRWLQTTPVYDLRQQDGFIAMGPRLLDDVVVGQEQVTAVLNVSGFVGFLLSQAVLWTLALLGALALTLGHAQVFSRGRQNG